MSLQSTLQTPTANAALKIAQAVGEQITYTPTGGAAVTLYAIVGRSQTENAAGGGAVGDVRDNLRLVIPKQTNFPPATKIVDDTVVVRSTTYRVARVEADSIKAVYSVEAVLLYG